MAIEERIRHIRGLTLKFLGKAAGFPEKTADTRMSQYEKGARTPTGDLTQRLAEVLEVSSCALSVPDIDTPEGLMHTFTPCLHSKISTVSPSANSKAVPASTLTVKPLNGSATR